MKKKPSFGKAGTKKKKKGAKDDNKWMEELEDNPNELELKERNIGAEGAFFLASSLLMQKTLKTLTIRQDAIGDGGAQALARALSANNVTLTTLTLAETSIGVDGVRSLAKSLESNTTLEVLLLPGNNLGNEGAEIIWKTLAHNPSLKRISLASNGIDDKGLAGLPQALQTNTSLVALFLDSNQLSKRGGKLLSKGLKSNTTLSRLALTHNNLGKEGIEALGKGLRNNTALTELFLADNGVARNQEAARGLISSSTPFGENTGLVFFDLVSGLDEGKALFERNRNLRAERTSSPLWVSGEYSNRNIQPGSKAT